MSPKTANHEEKMALVKAGGIPLFTTFPLDQIPGMQPIRIEPLSDSEIKLYDKKTVVLPELGKDRKLGRGEKICGDVGR